MADLAALRRTLLEDAEFEKLYATHLAEATRTARPATLDTSARQPEFTLAVLHFCTFVLLYFYSSSVLSVSSVVNPFSLRSSHPSLRPVDAPLQIR